MKEYVNKFIKLEKDLSREKGDFSLFALFLREESQNKWDLLVSAPWIEQNRKESLRYIAGQIQEKLPSEDLLQLSRIVVIDKENPALEAITRAVNIQHASAEIKDSMFFGLPIEHAYIITSQRPRSAADATNTG